jgi:hypothetical protein
VAPSTVSTKSREPIKPIVGATTMGMRRRIDCTVKPIVRLSRARASPTTAKSVGLAIEVQVIVKAKATNANRHVCSEAKIA